MPHSLNYKVEFLLVLIFMTLIEYMPRALLKQVSVPTVFESVSVVKSYRGKETYVVFRLGKVKVKCTLVQALRLCIGRTAYRGRIGIAIPSHDHGTRR
jgi:hypothetical protein